MATSIGRIPPLPCVSPTSSPASPPTRLAARRTTPSSRSWCRSRRSCRRAARFHRVGRTSTGRPMSSERPPIRDPSISRPGCARTLARHRVARSPRVVIAVDADRGNPVPDAPLRRLPPPRRCPEHESPLVVTTSDHGACYCGEREAEEAASAVVPLDDTGGDAVSPSRCCHRPSDSLHERVPRLPEMRRSHVLPEYITGI